VTRVEKSALIRLKGIAGTGGALYFLSMINSATVSRTQLIYGLCLPLAALIGFFLAEPMQFGTAAVIGMVASILVWPVFVRWYHPLLVGSFHCSFILGFLPGYLPIWMAIAFAGLLFVIFQRCLDSRVSFFPPGGVSWSLLAIAVVIVLTALIRGGIGLQSLGGQSMGSRKYIVALLGVATYFVLVTRAVPRKHALVYMGLFCLSGLTGMLSHLIYLGGSKFYWLYRFVDSMPALGQSAAEWDVQGQTLVRSLPLMGASISVISFMLACFGVRGLLQLRKPWRLGFLVMGMAIGLFGGFRSYVVGMAMLLGVAFFLEGLHRTRYLPILVTAAVMSVGVLLIVSDKLPLSVQRSVSFLPVKIDAGIQMDAQGSVEWRLQMWDIVRREIPDYLLVGKGYAIDPTAMEMSGFNSHFGFDIQAEWAVLAGEYHNGPLSVLIPFGIAGVLAFVWFLVAGLLRLRWFLRYGDPALLNINRALCAMFVAKILFFTFCFGAFYSELVEFVVFVALAECLNAIPKVEEKPEPVWAEAIELGEEGSA